MLNPDSPTATSHDERDLEMAMPNQPINQLNVELTPVSLGPSLRSFAIVAILLLIGASTLCITRYSNGNQNELAMPEDMTADPRQLLMSPEWKNAIFESLAAQENWQAGTYTKILHYYEHHDWLETEQPFCEHQLQFENKWSYTSVNDQQNWQKELGPNNWQEDCIFQKEKRENEIEGIEWKECSSGLCTVKYYQHIVCKILKRV